MPVVAQILHSANFVVVAFLINTQLCAAAAYYPTAAALVRLALIPPIAVFTCYRFNCTLEY